jgi:hypothetical protein
LLPFAHSSNNDDDDLLVASEEQCNDYFDFCKGADESVVAGRLNNKNKHTELFHRILKYSNQETACT